MSDSTKFSNPIGEVDPTSPTTEGSAGGADEKFSSKQIFDAMKAKDAGAEEVASDNPVIIFWNMAVRPDNRYRLYWDVFVLGLVVYSAVVIPYNIAFVGQDKDRTFVEDFVDACFWADIIISFWTGYDKGYEIVMDKEKIWRNYVYGWFPIDLAATLDWSILFSVSSTLTGGEFNPGAHVAEMQVSMLKMLKVLRLARLSRLINRITATWQMNSAFVDAAKFFFWVFMAAHLLASVFYMMPLMFDCDPSTCIESCGESSRNTLLPLDPAEYVSEGAQMAMDNTVGFVTDVEIEPDLDTCIEGFNKCPSAIVGSAAYNAKQDVDFSATNWYHPATCLQGSWRQGYGLEEICETGSSEVQELKLRQCQLMSELGLLPKQSVVYRYNPAEKFALEIKCHSEDTCWNGEWTNEDQASVGVDGYILFIGPESECKKCMNAWRLWVDSMYWSLTTMTTIGYGDRGPSTEEEIIFVMMAEVGGLAVFALLLDQIVNLRGALAGDSQRQKDEKDAIVSFLVSKNLDGNLVKESVRYLNFRASSVSGRAFDPDAPEFVGLSVGLKDDIQHALYRPVLERVHFFGHNPDDIKESERCLAQFKAVDTEGSDTLSKDEIQVLLRELDVKLTESQFNDVFDELDRHKSNDISYEEFHRWWFLNTTGLPQGTPCPDDFINAMCTKVQVEAFAIRDEIVHAGEYGDNLLIVMSGEVVIFHAEDPDVRSKYYHARVSDWPSYKDGGDETQVLVINASHPDDEPIIGFAAVLPEEQFEHVRECTKDWVVRASDYTDSATISRDDILECFLNTWPEGMAKMSDCAYELYEKEKIDSVLRTSSSAAFETEDGSATPDVASTIRSGSLEARVSKVEDSLKSIDKKCDRIIKEIQSVGRAGGTYRGR
jgi:hypothetical protein